MMYRHGDGLPLPPSEAHLCSGTSDSPTGLIFYNGNQFSGQWQNQVFWIEGSKRCLLYFEKLPDGSPDVDSLRVMAFTPEVPGQTLKPGQFVDIQLGQDGAIYLVDVFYGAIHKVEYVGSPDADTPPVAVISASPPSSPTSPVTVQLDASSSFDTDIGDSIVLFEFDAEGDGVFEASGGGAIVSHTYSFGVYVAIVRVTDQSGRTDTASTSVSVGSHLTISVDPVPRWSVGDVIELSATFTDGNGNAVEPTQLSISATLLHCSNAACEDADTRNQAIDTSNCHGHFAEATFDPSGQLAHIETLAHPMPSFMLVVRAFGLNLKLDCKSNVHSDL